MYNSPEICCIFSVFTVIYSRTNKNPWFRGASIMLLLNDLSNDIISNPIKPMQYTSEVENNVPHAINLMMSLESYLPENLSKPKFDAYIKESTLPERVKRLCKEYYVLFIAPTKGEYRPTTFDSPLTRAWFDCCILAGCLSENPNASLHQQIQEGLGNLSSFVEQVEQSVKGTIFNKFYNNVRISNVERTIKSITSAMSLIDLWRRNIVSVTDYMYQVKATNVIATYNLYKYAFPMMFIFSEEKSVKQKQIAKSMFEQFQGSKEELRNNTPFVNQILADCELEDSEVEQLYKEYVEKLEHSDKRTKKANLFNL